MAGLFPNSMRRIQERSRREFRGSDVGRVLGDVERAVRAGKTSTREFRGLTDKLKRITAGGALARVAGATPTGRAIGQVLKYAKGNQTAIESILDALGPMGNIFRSIMRPNRSSSAIDRDLGVAADFLRAFGADVKMPDRRPGSQRKSKSVRDAKKLLKSLGFTVTPPKSRRRPRNPSTKPPKFRVLDTQEIEDVQIGGRNRKYPANDPILTGEMIDVQSSNVHSIGFIWNEDNPMKGTLQIRFLQSRSGGKKSGAGPLYYYEGVHPDVFTSFRNAASKGVFVWDRIRIRGTVSGHRFPYKLAGITGGYVPRKATRYGDSEYFIRRSVKARSTRTGQERTFESGLPDQRAGRHQPDRPDFGMPNRGTPDRGR